MKTLTFLFICICLTIPCSAGIITVDDDGPADYSSLQDALAGAGSGDQILVAEGTYKPDQGSGITPGDRNATFQLKNGVEIYGGYSGFAPSDPNGRDIDLYETILSGDLNGDDDPNFVNNDENSCHVVTGSSTGATAMLDGFTITGGNGNLAGDELGGGMKNDSGSPTVNNCNFKANFASSTGGGVCNRSGSQPTFMNCIFSGNSVDYGGGAMYNTPSSNAIIIKCVFSGNSAEWGGAFKNYQSSPTLTDCVFNENFAGSDGGVMHNFQCNSAIVNCTFTGNISNGNGGVMLNAESNPTVADCIFNGNSAIGAGGGIAGSNGAITNCLFYGNSADKGGALNNCDGQITNCTFANNTAATEGGGIRGCDGSITNCIIWGNIPDQLYLGSDPSYSCIQDWAGGGTGNISSNPDFVGGGDYHLQPGSGCIDSGTNSPPGGLPATDLDGNPRPIDGDNNGQAIADMGAYENLPYYEEPVIALSAHNFNFSAYEGGTNPDDQIVTVRNSGIGTLNWEITEECDWLTVNPDSGSSTGEADAVILSVDITSLAWGNYNCELTVSDPNAVNSPQIVSVDLEIIGPIIELSESSFDFQAEVDGINPDDQILTIRNAGAGILNWQITEECDWLSVIPDSGSSTGEADAVILSVDISGLGEDEYSCDLTISDPNSENSPQMVQVNLSVIGVPHIWVNPYSFDVEVLEGMSLADTLTIGNSGTGDLSFSIKTRETSREISQTLLSGGTAASRGSFSTEKMIRLEYEFDEPIASRGQEYDMLQIEGLELYQRTGAPIIPVHPVTVLVPYGKEVKAVRVVLLDSFQLPGTYLLPPAQEPHPLSFKGVIERTAPDPAIYDQPLSWPGINQEQIDTQSKRGYQLFTVNLFPLQYEPVSGIVTYTLKMVLQIDLTDSVKLDDLPVLRPSETVKAELNRKVDNPDALGSYPSEQVSGGNLRYASSLPSSGPYKYVIITNTTLEGASGPYNFQALRDSKITQGTSATIVTTDWIYANYDGTRPDGGTDNQTRIRNFLIDAYQTWSTEYVLLGGTNSIVPARMFWVEAWPGGDVDTMPVDMYYGCVDPAACTFDYDQDGRYAEPADGVGGADVDLYAEIYVGRAPVANATELANFIGKTLTYDSTQSEYLPLISMVGEHLGFGGVAEYAKDAMEQIRLGGSYDGYFTYGFENHLNETFYDFDTSTNLYDKDGSWPKSTLINLMNNSVHVLNHLGHANYTYDMKLSTSDLSSLTNTDYFFAYSQGCMPGGFDITNCFAEVITSMEYGAFAVVMNARYGWGTYNSTDGPSQRFDRQFWDAVLDEDMLELGRANQDSKEDNLWDINGSCIRWCYYELNLFGDPQQQFRFEEACEWLIIEPQEGNVAPQDSNDLSVTFDPTGLAIGTYQAEIIITSDDPDFPITIVPVTMTVRPDDLEVTPDEDFKPSGTEGGPFEPECKNYTLTNNGTEVLSWSTEETEDWLEISPYDGSLDPNESVLVNVCITSVADLLDPNTYTDTITFLNENSGKVHSRTVRLVVMPPDTFTESFDSGDNDLDNLTMTFRPDGSIAYYAACRENEVITEFPTDPCGGTYVGLGDDDFAEVILTGGAEVMFYGQSYDHFYIGSNGYITFSDGDWEFFGTLEYHFDMPRISAVFTDLSPADTQSISYKQLEDRLAVTFEDVPLYGDKDALNSFQIEIFFIDETIRITWLDIAATDGVAGLSEGVGLTELFIESDLTEYISCCPCGDFNADNFVNLTDFAILGLSWMETDCNSPHWCSRIDIDRSTEVGIGDVSFAAYNWLLGDPVSQGPVAHWKFDESSGSTAYDSAGSNDGTLVNDPNWTTGKIDGALSFDSDYDEYVDVVGYKGITGTASRTCAAWIKTTTTYNSIMTWGDYSASGTKWKFYLTDYNGADPGAIQVDDATGRIVGSTDIRDNQWHHVAAVLEDDGSPDVSEIKLYVDGIEETYSEITPSQINTGNTNDVLIGALFALSGSFVYHFDGQIDDVRIYDRALSESEIRELAGLSNEPVAHWMFDEGSGSIAYDSAGSNDGTLIGDPNWTDGKINGALNFNGNGGHVNCGNDSSLDMGESVTLCAWVKPNESDSGRVIFSRGYYNSGSDSKYIIAAYRHDTKNYQYKIRHDNNVKEIFAPGLENVWQHIAVTYNSGVMELYIDGVLAGEIAGADLQPDVSDHDLKIGAYVVDSAYFDGAIDDTRIYDRVLSSGEVQQLYLEGLDEEMINCLPW